LENDEETLKTLIIPDFIGNRIAFMRYLTKWQLLLLVSQDGRVLAQKITQESKSTFSTEVIYSFALDMKAT